MLTDKQEKFCLNIVSGMNQSDAYRNSYDNNMTDKQIWEEEWLTRMLNDNEATRNEKLKALDILNKMDGEYVTKVEGNMNLSYEDKLKEIVDANEY